jgi:hypothetical protein
VIGEKQMIQKTVIFTTFSMRDYDCQIGEDVRRNRGRLYTCMLAREGQARRGHVYKPRDNNELFLPFKYSVQGGGWWLLAISLVQPQKTPDSTYYPWHLAHNI